MRLRLRCRLRLQSINPSLARADPAVVAGATGVPRAADVAVATGGGQAHAPTEPAEARVAVKRPVH